MSTKKCEQEHVPMVITNSRHQDETKNTCGTTTTTANNRLLVETNTRCHRAVVPGNRDNWSNRVVYLLSIIGFVVDLGKCD
jgi:hypothetical protein